jgi:hypothetical protein
MAPEDGVEPVGAISHGLCAPCAAKWLALKSPFWYPVKIAGFKVELRIQPGRQAPHVAADSPRYWEGARPVRVIETRVSHGGVELDPAGFRDLLSLARERANLPGGRPSARPAFSRQLRLGLRMNT